MDKYASVVTLSHVHLGQFRLEPYLENPLPRGGLVILIFKKIICSLKQRMVGPGWWVERRSVGITTGLGKGHCVLEQNGDLEMFPQPFHHPSHLLPRPAQQLK